MKMQTKSEQSETDAEVKLSSGSNLVEDLDDEFIFQSAQVHEPSIVDHIATLASEVPNNINEKNGEDYIPASTRNLNPPGKVSVDGRLSDVKCVRLSNILNQRLGGITRHSS